MGAHGFNRATARSVYKRTYKQSLQFIDIQSQVMPKDRPNALAAIYPMMEVMIESVDQKLSDIVAGDIGLLEGVTGGTSIQPIGFTSEKKQNGRWFVLNVSDVAGIIVEVKDFIEKWTMPFLDVYGTAEEIVAADQRNDCRLPRDRAQILRVVAAALVCDRREYAIEVMRKWLGSPGARRRYQRVYDYVQEASC
jgi:hypothetical protein